MVAGIVGLVSIWGEAQDQTVAAVTPWNSFPWRNLETTKKSGFAKTITELQAEIIVLEEEFQKWKINSKEMQEMLSKLLHNEKTLMIETQKTLDTIWSKLERVYEWLPEASVEKESVKKLWITILTLKTHLAEDFNLITAVRLVHTMSQDETYRNETTSVNRPYFKGIAEYIDRITTTTLTAVQSYEKSFNAQPTDRMGTFRDTLLQLSEKVEVGQEAEIDKGNIILDWKIDDRMFGVLPEWIILNKKAWTLFLPNTSTVAIFKKEILPGKYKVWFRGDSTDVKIWLWSNTWQPPVYITPWQDVVVEIKNKSLLNIYCTPNQPSPITLHSISIVEVE